MVAILPLLFRVDGLGDHGPTAHAAEVARQLLGGAARLRRDAGVHPTKKHGNSLIFLVLGIRYRLL